jgi:hypothetical protein
MTRSQGRRCSLIRSALQLPHRVIVLTLSDGEFAHTAKGKIVRPEGFEPPISAFGGPRVIQLRYGRKREPGLLRLLG